MRARVCVGVWWCFVGVVFGCGERVWPMVFPGSPIVCFGGLGCGLGVRVLRVACCRVLGQCALGAWFLLILGPLFAAVYCCCGCCGGGGFGFGGCGWVGCELYSGREHLCFVCFVVVCFFERLVDALASGADEGRGGLR